MSKKKLEKDRNKVKISTKPDKVDSTGEVKKEPKPADKGQGGQFVEIGGGKIIPASEL